MPTRLSIETAAKVWCRPECSSIEMDARLATAFAEVLDEIWSKAWLGNATTGEMLDEIRARVDVNYKTTGDNEIKNPTCPVTEAETKLREALTDFVGANTPKEWQKMLTLVQSMPDDGGTRNVAIKALKTLLKLYPE